MMTATLTKWYDERGRHEIFAGDKRVSIGKPEHTLALKDELVTTDVQHDLDQLGVAKNAREEKMRARDAEMAKLYRKHVLQEPEGAELITLSAITPALKPRADRPERDETEVDSFGD
jgi:7,8-dihydro-6-hydroxymethylpterin dimethyltransferase